MRKTSCPIWNSSFELVCTTSLQEQYISAEVYDKDRIVQNFLIGEVQLNVLESEMLRTDYCQLAVVRVEKHVMYGNVWYFF